MNNVYLAKVDPLHKLLGFKLAWHGKVMKDVLIKYKLLIIFLLLLLAPSFHSLVYIISLPAKAIVSKETSLLNYFQSILSCRISF